MNSKEKVVMEMKPLNVKILQFLVNLGLLEEIPEEHPGPRKPLARSVCFLHDEADNPYGFMLYADGYACETGKCHQDRTFGCNLPGLVRHLVYRVTGEVMDWRAAWKYAQGNVDRLKELVGDNVRPGKKTADRDLHVEWSAEDLAACLEVPDPYYLSRGYLPETLKHFGVGRCVRPLPDDRALLGWSVVPVLDSRTSPPHGYTARNPRWVKGADSPKWVHAVSRNRCLFNHWGAMQSRLPLIICEGPGDVMRFWEAGLKSAVAVMGSSLTEGQYGCVLSLQDTRWRGDNLYIAADADDAGQKFAEQASFKLKGICNPVAIFPTRTKDFGDATVDEIRALAL